MGISLVTGAVVGLLLRPNTTQHAATVISAMQAVVLAGTAAAFAARLFRTRLPAGLLICMVGTGSGLILATGGLLPPMQIAKMVLAAWMWCAFIFGLSAATDCAPAGQWQLPAIPATLSIILTLWPIMAAPLIGAVGGSPIGAPINWMLNLSPAIWLIHITQGFTGMNTIGWFHSHLLYRVVPLGQNVLMPKLLPWYLAAAALGAGGAGMIGTSAWRRRRQADTDPVRLASAQQCR